MHNMHPQRATDRKVLIADGSGNIFPAYIKWDLIFSLLILLTVTVAKVAAFPYCKQFFIVVSTC